jgi:N-dimethylarginine dimethylaminohydrolase
MRGLNEYGRLKRVALRHAREAFGSQAVLTRQWRDLNYHAEPDFAAALREYDAFAGRLEALGVAIDWLPAEPTLTPDAIYVRDATLLSPQGLIACAMGKPQRRRESTVNLATLTAAGLPAAGEINGAGSAEGGDAVWLDEKTFVIGHGYRTNAAGIAQLKALLGPEVHVEVAQLPHYKGPSDVFHLMSVLSPLDRDLALVFSPLMPAPLRLFLLERGLTLVEVPQEEFASMGCNVLALAPRHVLMLDGNTETARRLQAAGCQIEFYAGQQISRLGEGGPTCLTRPLEREA